MQLVFSSLLIMVAGAAVIAAPSDGPAACERASSDWIVEEGDNICGLTDPRQITNPASVDYGELLRATPEIKEMRRRGIDRTSPEGQVLHNKAVDRIRTAASRIMRDKGYDSVWKQIRHRQGQRVPSVTDEIREKLAPSDPD